MLRLLPLVLVGFLALPGCATAPPQLSPAGQAAFQKTRVIKGLDLLRDFAIDGEAAQPQVVSKDTTRKIVKGHQAALKILDAAGTGWPNLVSQVLDGVVSELNAPDRAKVAPYVALVKALLSEVQ